MIAREEPLADVAYVYDGTTEGLLTAVFHAYERHEDPQDLCREGMLQPRLGQSMLAWPTDPQLAQRVAGGLQRACGHDAFQRVVHASLSDDPDCGSAVYRFIRYALPPRPAKARPQAIEEAAYPAVRAVLDLDRAVMNERHRLMQFLRFEHLENGAWFARCNPNASVVPLLMDWFSARFNTQPFMIYDEVHRIAGVYEGRSWYLVATDGVDLPARASEEKLMCAAWRRFYDAIAIDERYNPELRRQFMPMRLWKNIVEVQDELPREMACATRR